MCLHATKHNDKIKVNIFYGGIIMEEYKETLEIVNLFERLREKDINAFIFIRDILKEFYKK